MPTLLLGRGLLSSHGGQLRSFTPFCAFQLSLIFQHRFHVTGTLTTNPLIERTTIQRKHAPPRTFADTALFRLIGRIAHSFLLKRKSVATSDYQSAATSDEKKVKRSKSVGPFHLRSRPRRTSGPRGSLSLLAAYFYKGHQGLLL
jgi:hypothetical protein